MNFVWWYHGVDFAVSRVQVEICKHSWHLEFVPDGSLAPFCLCVDMCWKITYCRVSEAYSTLCLGSIGTELPFWVSGDCNTMWILGFFSLFHFLSSFLCVSPFVLFCLLVMSFCCKSVSNRKTQPWYWLVVISGELWSPLGLVCFSTVFCFLCVCFGFPSSFLSVFPILCCFVVSC